MIPAKDHGGHLRLKPQAKPRRLQPAARHGSPSSNVIVDRFGCRCRDDPEMRRTSQARNQVELQTGHQGAGKPGVKKLDAGPTLHNPSHQSARQGINTDRLLRDPVLAEPDVSFDHLAMGLEGLAHGESQPGVAEHEPCHTPTLPQRLEPDHLWLGATLASAGR